MGRHLLLRRRAHHGRAGHAAILRPHRRAKPPPAGAGRPLRAGAALHQAGHRRGTGHHLHRRHRDGARAGHRDRRRHRAISATGVPARHRATGWRALPLPHPHRLGQCDVPAIHLRGIQRRARAATGLRAGSASLRPTHGAGAGTGRDHLRVRPHRPARHQEGRNDLHRGRGAGRGRVPTRHQGASLRHRGFQGGHSVVRGAAKGHFLRALSATGARLSPPDSASISISDLRTHKLRSRTLACIA